MTGPIELTESEERALSAAVEAWQIDTDGGAWLDIMAIDADARREALRRLGYSTPMHLALFALGPAQ